MSKRKLTLRQSAIVKKQQQRHLQKLLTPEEEASLGAEQRGLLVALYGVEAEVESLDGTLHRCKLRQNLGSIVVGDQVVWRELKNDGGVIEAVLPRRSLMSRPTREGSAKAIAANVDQVFIVIAPQPKPALNLLDSYLVAVESLQLTPIIIFNKIDLLTAESQLEFSQWLSIYQQLDYRILHVSAVEQQGLAALKTLLQHHTSVFVGQSGVGKSSLLRGLLATAEIKVGAATEHVHGLHTTTAARLYHLDGGGDVIDSPGVRDFILWQMTPAQIAAGFKEFRAYLGQCKFRDCDHWHNAGCALQQALEDGKISAQRFNSYQRLSKA